MDRTKGTHVLNAVKVLRGSRERALAALPPELHKYLEQRILPSSWYSTEDHLALLRVIASMMPVAPDPWVVMGRGTARMDLGGIYRNYLRAGDPERTLAWMGALWRSAHDSGEVNVTIERPGVAVVTMTRFEVKSRGICGIVTGYLMETIELTGARGARVRHTSCRCVENAPECVWRVSWDADAPSPTT
jgi:hypothetical protein